MGSSGEAHALVADPRGDPQRGGVTATGALSDNLVALIGEPEGAVSGTQQSGPHPAPPAGLARAFLEGCGDVEEYVLVS